MDSNDTPEQNQEPVVFTFGEPEECLTNNPLDHLGLFADFDGVYQPPIDPNSLFKLLDVNAMHGPLLEFKCNQIMLDYVPSDTLPSHTMRKVVFDYLVTSNAYLSIHKNVIGQISKATHVPARIARATKTRGVFGRYDKQGVFKKFRKNSIVHIKNYDPRQSVYGHPLYFGGLQSALLNEQATLFRRKFYKNGAHMGYIFHVNDPLMSDEKEEALKNAIKNSQGAGNYKSLFINTKMRDGDVNKQLRIIPIGDIGAKDDFKNIQQITSAAMLSMHRVPEELSCMQAGNRTSFGDIGKIEKYYYKNEVLPLQKVFLSVNEYLGADLIRFEKRFEEDD